MPHYHLVSSDGEAPGHGARRRGLVKPVGRPAMELDDRPLRGRGRHHPLGSSALGLRRASLPWDAETGRPLSRAKNLEIGRSTERRSFIRSLHRGLDLPTSGQISSPQEHSSPQTGAVCDLASA